MERPGSSHVLTATPMAPTTTATTTPPQSTRRSTLPGRYTPAAGEANLGFVPASYTSSRSSSDSDCDTPPSHSLASLSSLPPASQTVAFLLRPRLLAARFRRQPLVLVLATGLVLFSLLLLASGRRGTGLATAGDVPRLRWGFTHKDDIPVPAAASHAPPDDEPPCPSDGLATIDACATTRLPNIPPKIWQIYLDFQPRILAGGFIPTWLARAPSHAYVLLDAAGATSVVQRLARLAGGATADGVEPTTVSLYRPVVPAVNPAVAPADAAHNSNRLETAPLAAFAQDALQLYAGMPRRVLRADFLRYLVLALEGGVYSDFDTALERPVREWVPAGLRADTRLIVGLEADQSPPVKGTTYPVQFCQWTLASAAGHPALWTMTERILARVRTRAQASSMADMPEMTDADVLQITGPAAWTEVVYEHLNQVAGDGVGQPRITWHTLTGLKEPRLFGDTLVLPIDGFATGVPHSHASRTKTERTLVQHHFRGDWKNNNG